MKGNRGKWQKRAEWQKNIEWQQVQNARRKWRAHRELIVFGAFFITLAYFGFHAIAFYLKVWF